MTPLDGGPKDEIPPAVVSSLPDSAQLNVPLDTRKIQLQFDEYVQGKDLRNLLILSPNVEGGLESEVRGKKLIVSLSKDLQSNTTYSLQINGSIADVNENNVLEDYQLYFSTGDYIDSMFYEARIIDAYTREACEDCIIALYRDQNDSSTILSRPDYIGRTSKQGRVRINNLAPQSFLAVAMQDKNKNLKLDFDEQVALSRTVQIIDSSGIDSFYVFPYQRKVETKFTLNSSYPGNVDILFTPYMDDSLVLKDGDDTLFYSMNLTRDSLLSYVPINGRDTIPLVMIRDSLVDTLTYVPPKVKINETLSANWVQGRSLRIFLPSPGQLHTDSLKLIQDSTTIPFRSEQKALYLEIWAKWLPDQPLQVVLPDSFFTDLNGRSTHGDTLRPSQIQALSTLQLNLELKEGRSFIIELLRDNTIIHRVVRNHGTHQVRFTGLNPSPYRVRIIRDENENGRWDPGSFFDVVPPEDIILSTEVEVRENWDNTLIINN